MWSHIADWPEPVALVDGVAIAKKDLVADLQAAVEGGVLANDVDEVTGMRAAATALEARIDALIVQKAVASLPTKAALAGVVDAELAGEVKRAGGKDGWLKSIARRGQTEESRKRALVTQAGLDALAVHAGAVLMATDAELRERFEHQQKLLTLPAALRLREVSVPLPPTPTAAQVTAAEARLNVQVKAGKLTAPEGDWQTRRELGAERWQAAQALKPGQLSAVVRSPFGVHRMQVVEKRAEHVQTWAEAKPRLAAYVKRFRTFEAGHALLLKLRAQAKVQRMSPFDHPPGGLPLAGDVTMGAFEEDDD